MSGRRQAIFVLFPVLVLALAAGGASAPNAAAPRIVAAAMQDADGDFRADSIRLTYSLPVRHARDRDRVYPFSVAGYVVRSVGAASGRALVITLVEKTAPDPTARPSVSYRQTRSKPVTSKAGRQAVAQTFRATRAHGHTPPAPAQTTTTVVTVTQPQPLIDVDSDGDGTLDSKDCAPHDPAIHPGAVDLPDLAFVDSNCDGIDGQEAKAVFASTFGKDTDPGTKANPKRTIDAAVIAAKGTARYVLAAGGSYPSVTAATGVGIFGGYDPKTWQRSKSQTTQISGFPGLLADNATGVTLQLISVVGAPSAADRSVYGIRAVNGSSLTLQSVTVSAGAGIFGVTGQGGRAGANAANGASGERGTGHGGGGCVTDNDPHSGGGLGGISPVGRNGGNGGDGGAEGSNSGKAGGEGKFGTPGGAGGKGGKPGASGKNGDDAVGPGGPGIGGDGGTSSTARAGASWQGVPGAAGGLALSGNGGGGGGGSGGRGGIFVFDMAGHGGGGGGGGGAPGFPGDGGGFGGGSFGIYLFNSTLTAESSTITAGNGGSGGAGGNGGAGGHGGAGGRGPGGSSLECPEYVGKAGDGGHGADGGVGGAGGGGAGGPSVGVMKIGSSATLNQTTVKFGTAGVGGAIGTGGSGTAKPSQAGIAQAVYP